MCCAGGEQPVGRAKRRRAPAARQRAAAQADVVAVALHLALTLRPPSTHDTHLDYIFSIFVIWCVDSVGGSDLLFVFLYLRLWYLLRLQLKRNSIFLINLSIFITLK